MRHLLLTISFLFAFVLPAALRADVPMTEFFAIETTKLAALAPADATLDTLSQASLPRSALPTACTMVV